MRKGEYVLYDDLTWVVWLEHLDGTFQIKCLEPLKTWIDNAQVRPNQCTPITKEVADIIIGV